MVGYKAGDVIKGFRVQLLVVHFRQLLHAVVEISRALSTVLAMSAFTDTVTDAIAGRVSWGAVGCGKGMCDFGSFVVRNDEFLGGEPALQSQCVSLRVTEERDSDRTYTAILCGLFLLISEELYRPFLHLLV